MSLVIAGALGHEVPCGTRFLVMVVFALGVGLAFSFIGGTAAIKGQVAIPKLSQHLFTIAAAGRIGAMLLTLLLGTTFYANSSDCSDVVQNVRLRGRVLDADSTPVRDAQITVESHSFFARSEDTGDFEGELGAVKRGDYIRVRVTHKEYNSETRMIPISDPQIMMNDIRLKRFPR